MGALRMMFLVFRVILSFFGAACHDFENAGGVSSLLLLTESVQGPSGHKT